MDLFTFTEETLNRKLHFVRSRWVLGKLPPRKIAPSPNSNANPKPNPDPDQGVIFLGDNFPDTDGIIII